MNPSSVRHKYEFTILRWMSAYTIRQPDSVARLRASSVRAVRYVRILVYVASKKDNVISFERDLYLIFLFSRVYFFLLRVYIFS